VVLFIAVVMAVIVSGCGGGDSSSSDDSSSNVGKQSSTGTSTTASTDSGSEPSAEFKGKGKGPDSKIPTAGKEGSVEEREAASKVLEESLQARAARDWAGQCATLVKSVVEGIEKAGTVLGGGGGCAQALEAQAAPAPPSTLANTMTGPIDAFRVVGGARGFALYHGTKGKDYVMPMLKEGSEWKVASLTEKEMS